MRYLVLLEAAQPATPPPPGLLEAIMQLGEEAATAGALLDTAGLAPSAAGARVRLGGGSLTVTDGPFAEAKEMISYALYQVRSKEEAVEWTSRFMKLHRDLWAGWEGDAKVLRVYGPEDFGPAGPALADAPPG
ncbi:MAG TPA: YciI family protein [Pilimelia sp.]|nr:YciI family protein [Pilimelia sp.]